MKSVSSFSSRTVLAGALLITGLSASASASAQEDAAVTIGGSATFVTDYRFRGISLSNLDAAVQGGIDLTTQPGIFLSLWGSSIADFNGATTEIDVIFGWSGDVAGITPSFGVIGYFYPGGTGTDVFEFFGSIEVPLGPVAATFGLNWMPNQKNLGSSNRYAFGALSAAIPGSPITLNASLGNERGSLVFDELNGKTGKWDWSLGAELSWEALTFGVAYVGSDIKSREIGGIRYNRLLQDTVVFSISASF